MNSPHLASRLRSLPMQGRGHHTESTWGRGGLWMVNFVVLWLVFLLCDGLFTVDQSEETQRLEL